VGGQGGYLLTGVAENNQMVMTWHIITIRQHLLCCVDLASAHSVVTWCCGVVVVLQCAVVIVGSGGHG